ncbi:hypothetical protein SAMN04488591_2269 [Microbacterium azadirachtae]|uniref:DUF3800 domain-containing protein n=1 Tax=Microbacterium azadirachtae TaxID=582680 RepID=A0A1I6HYI4_9MICO|nr:hypothetical protein [Microbacterium azadirachtae]SFR59503.1 hypothetical protein SAMN04488591_2269 [Microbacterium azadirachtae]
MLYEELTARSPGSERLAPRELVKSTATAEDDRSHADLAPPVDTETRIDGVNETTGWTGGDQDPWAPSDRTGNAAPVWVFLDESKVNYGSTTVTATAAIVIANGDRATVESSMEALHGEILLGDNFWYDDDPARRDAFRSGFHATESNVRICDQVRDRIRVLPFRTYLAHSRRNTTAGTSARYASLYVSIISKLLRRYKMSSIAFVFEQHTELAPHFETIVSKARDRAGDARPVAGLVTPRTVGEMIHQPGVLVVAQGAKNVPGCAIADAVLYDFGTAVKAGLFEPERRSASTMYRVRYWTHELAPRVAYEYDFDRNEHSGRRTLRRRLASI